PRTRKRPAPLACGGPPRPRRAPGPPPPPPPHPPPNPPPPPRRGPRHHAHTPRNARTPTRRAPRTTPPAALCGANLDVGGARERWPVADGVANGAMKPGVATSTRLSVDHIAIWMHVEPGEIGRVVTRSGELLDGHEPIIPARTIHMETGHDPSRSPPPACASPAAPMTEEEGTGAALRAVHAHTGPHRPTRKPSWGHCLGVAPWATPRGQQTGSKLALPSAHGH